MATTPSRAMFSITTKTTTKIINHTAITTPVTVTTCKSTSIVATTTPALISININTVTTGISLGRR